MAEGPEELRTRLADLHRQLQGTRSVSGDLRTLLQEVLTDIDRVLADEAETRGTDDSFGLDSAPPLAQRLGEAARQFEDTHPQLAANVGSLVTALSRLGI